MMKKLLLTIAALSFATNSFAAQQSISSGAGILWGSEKDKINANFTELYSLTPFDGDSNGRIDEAYGGTNVLSINDLTLSQSQITGLSAALAAKADEVVLSSGEVGEIALLEDPDNGTNAVGFSAPASISTDLSWQLPNVDGGNGQALVTNGSGVLNWSAVNTHAVTISTSQPSGGSAGDIWYVVQ